MIVDVVNSGKFIVIREKFSEYSTEHQLNYVDYSQKASIGIKHTDTNNYKNLNYFTEYVSTEKTDGAFETPDDEMSSAFDIPLYAFDS